MTAAGLLERERELAAIDALLDGAARRHRPAAGDRGRGGDRQDRARWRGRGTRARARLHGADCGAAGCSRPTSRSASRASLFEPVATTRPARPARRGGRPGARPGAAPDRRARSSFELQHGLYWLVADLAERAPLLLAVDDAQWADPDSLRWLVYLARRLDELPVALLVAVRDGEPSGCSDAAAHRARDGGGRARAAQRGGRHALVRAALGAADDGSLRRLPRDERRQPVPARRAARRPRGRGGAERRARARPPGPPPCSAASCCGSRGSARRRSRWRRRSPSSGATPTSSTPPRSPSSTSRRARAAADALIAARVLDAAHPLRFAHPLLGSAVYADVGLARRARRPPAAAELLEQRAPERAALHLLSTHPGG